MIKYLIPLAFAVALTSCEQSAKAGSQTGNGQETGPATITPSTPQAETEKKIFEAALSMEDAITAQISAARLIQIDPANATHWKQELCKLYFLGRNFQGAKKLAEDVVKDSEGKAKWEIKEVLASCQEALGLKEAAKKSWTEVFENSQSPAQAVRLAGLQFESSEFKEALITIEAGLAAEGADKLMISLPKSEKEMQNVPVSATLHNLRGLITIQKSKPESEGSKPTAAGIAEARKHFDAALKIMPDFEIAKRNLESLSPAADAKASQGLAPTIEAAATPSEPQPGQSGKK